MYLMSVTLLLFSTSCMKPYQEEIYVEVEPNETAFVIPLEEGTKENQTKLKSEQYLEQKKVVAKRIYTPTQWHDTGRMWWSGKYIPTVRVIKVNRAPITREWTAANGTGTKGNMKEDIEVESRESIGFGIGITSTASIPEEWASKFLYNYNGKTLAQVMDNDVRAYIQNILTSEFGIRELSKCQGDRKVIFDTMRTQTINYFAGMGVRILNIGAAGQFNYIDEAIQTSINAQFSSEKKIIAAENEVQAANKFARAAESIRKQKNLDADMNIKDAIATAIRTGKLNVPNTIVSSGNGNMSIMDLYASQNLK